MFRSIRQMLGMDGDELATGLRAQAGASPLVLVAVTAMNDEESRRRVREAGFAVHLVKPVDPHNLLAVVDELWRAWTAAGAETDKRTGSAVAGVGEGELQVHARQEAVRPTPPRPSSV
jgi:DNA-binding response OmpR family regulator